MYVLELYSIDCQYVLLSSRRLFAHGSHGMIPHKFENRFLLAYS
jgi:hypothetical protein